MIALLLVAAALQSLAVPIDADVSWLITVSERVLHGQRLYVDVFEVNPPASVWLYLPQVALAQALGLRPEFVIVVLTLAAAALSTLATRTAVDRLEQRLPALPLLGALGFLTMIAPGGLFAQREHYALMLALPVAAVMAQLDARVPTRRRTLILAGVAGGMIVVIKPHFLFVLLFPAAYCCWRSRRIGPIAICAGAAAAVIAAYALAVLLFARPYFNAVPMLAEVYGPMRQTTFKLLTGVAIMSPIALGAIVYVLRPGRRSPLTVILLAMMAGFTLAALIQGKGYWNHALPAISLGIFAIALGSLDPHQPHQKRIFSGVVAALFGGGLLWSTLIIQPPRGLVPLLQTVAPPRAKVISLGTELSIGHPAVRLIGGTWVGSRAALFTAAGVRYRTGNWSRPASAELKRWYDEDIALFARDVAMHRPDIILVENESLPWLSHEPAIAAVMHPYREVAHAEKVGIWTRRGVGATLPKEGTRR